MKANEYSPKILRCKTTLPTLIPMQVFVGQVQYCVFLTQQFIVSKRSFGNVQVDHRIAINCNTTSTVVLKGASIELNIFFTDSVAYLDVSAATELFIKLQSLSFKEQSERWSEVLTKVIWSTETPPKALFLELHKTRRPSVLQERNARVL